MVARCLVGARHAVPLRRLTRQFMPIDVTRAPACGVVALTTYRHSDRSGGISLRLWRSGVPSQREIPRLRLRPPLGMTVVMGRCPSASRHAVPLPRSMVAMNGMPFDVDALISPHMAAAVDALDGPAPLLAGMGRYHLGWVDRDLAPAADGAVD